jgi:hypothetical protein
VTILVYEFPHKRQTKAMDCWYACVQMLLTWQNAWEKSKPRGAAISSHRNRFALGRKLSFGTPTGKRVQTDNGLVEVGLDLRKDDIDTVERVLRRHGPFIIGGDYGPCGAGHFVVICGVDTANNRVLRENPGWGYGRAWKPLSYLDKAWGPKQPEGMISSDSAVALRATA